MTSSIKSKISPNAGLSSVRNMDVYKSDLKADGAQSVDRACELLKQIARYGVKGARMVDLTADSGLSRPTVHRLLGSLAQASMVVRNEETKRFRVGPAIFELGLGAVSPISRLSEIMPLISELAKTSGDMVVLLFRRGDEGLYIGQAAGDFPIKTDIVRVGDLRPLASSIAGIGILGALEDDVIAGILDRTAKDLLSYSTFTREQVLLQVERVRNTGMSYGDSVIVEGITGIGRGVPNPYGTPYLGISIAAITSRMSAERLESLSAQLEATTIKVSRLLSS